MHSVLAFKQGMQLGVDLSQRIFLRRQNWQDWTGFCLLVSILPIFVGLVDDMMVEVGDQQELKADQVTNLSVPVGFCSQLSLLGNMSRIHCLPVSCECPISYKSHAAEDCVILPALQRGMSDRKRLGKQKPYLLSCFLSRDSFTFIFHCSGVYCSH